MTSRYYGNEEVYSKSGDYIYTKHNTLLWVSPGSVRYDLEDMEFLLPWLYEMREGVYPAEPGDKGGKRGSTTRAYYEAACTVAAEIDTRLAMTGMDREIVEKSYMGGLEDYQIARWYHKTEWEVRKIIKSVVSYISSGTCPRWIVCIDCQDYGKCRKKNKSRRAYTYQEWVNRRRRDWEKMELR